MLVGRKQIVFVGWREDESLSNVHVFVDAQ